MVTFQGEPAVTVGTVTAAVAAVVSLLVAFGVELSQDQQVAILGLVAVVAPVLVGLVVRGKVVPLVNIDEVADDEFLAGPE